VGENKNVVAYEAKYMRKIQNVNKRSSSAVDIQLPRTNTTNQRRVNGRESTGRERKAWLPNGLREYNTTS
jgi:hypothetical protein